MRNTDIGVLLVQEGIISTEILKKAKAEAARRRETLEFVLLDTGSVSEKDLAKTRGMAMRVDFVDLDMMSVDEELARCIPEHMAFRYRAIPVRHEGNLLTLAMADPVDVIAIDDIRLITGFDIRPAIATHSAIMKQLRHSFRGEEISAVPSPPLNEAPALPDMDMSAEKLLELVDEAPIVRVVNLIISQAINDGASELFLIPREDALCVSFLINDVLTEVMTPPLHIQKPVMARLKIMAGMDPLKEGSLQKGDMTLSHGERLYRLSVIADRSPCGEMMRVIIARAD
jgi:type IV pilus assembly protein PilB